MTKAAFERELSPLSATCYIFLLFFFLKNYVIDFLIPSQVALACVFFLLWIVFINFRAHSLSIYGREWKEDCH